MEINTFLSCAGALALLHWFPWRKMFWGHNLPRLVAYAIGTLVIVGLPTYQIWRSGLTLPMWETVSLFWVALAGAGVGTLGAWIVDALLEGMHLKADASGGAE